MSDYEDNDDDLPSISFSQTSGKKSSLEMPPAMELAAAGTREPSAEPVLEHKSAALDDLALPPAPPATADGDEVDELALSAAVSALCVTGAPQPRCVNKLSERLELVQAMRRQLPEGPDAEFLDAYIQALKDTPEASGLITEQILCSIVAALKRGRVEGPGVVAVGAWLLCCALTGGGGTARRAHRALLETASEHELCMLVRVCVRALRTGARLLGAHDAARDGARGAADRLARQVLGAALITITATTETSTEECEEPPDPLSAETAARAHGAWRRLPPIDQLLLARAVARALAGRAEGEPGEALLAALTQPLPRTALTIERLQVLSTVSKLQLLFGATARAPTPEPEPEPRDVSNVSYGAGDANSDDQHEHATPDATQQSPVAELPAVSAADEGGEGAGVEGAEGSPARKRRRRRDGLPRKPHNLRRNKN